MGTGQMIAAIRKDEKLSVRRQCGILEINRGKVYYQPKVDKRHAGSQRQGIRGLLRLMGIMAHYPQRHLCKPRQS